MASISQQYQNNKLQNELLFVLFCKRGNFQNVQQYYVYIAIATLPSDIRAYQTTLLEGYNVARANKHYEISSWISRISGNSSNCVQIKKQLKIHELEKQKQNKLKKWVDNLQECCICLESDSNMQTECGHQFCNLCIETVYDKSSDLMEFTCPLCRFSCKLSNCIHIVEIIDLTK